MTLLYFESPKEFVSYELFCTSIKVLLKFIIHVILLIKSFYKLLKTKNKLTLSNLKVATIVCKYAKTIVVKFRSHY